MYEVITSRHKQLRTAEASGAAGAAWADADALRDYAAAASKIGTRRWVIQGIEWCAAFSSCAAPAPGRRHAPIFLLVYDPKWPPSPAPRSFRHKKGRLAPLAPMGMQCASIPVIEMVEPPSISPVVLL
eukprot:scaffold14426_cov93-Isochrysis_galbana.AAC.2